MKKAGKAKKGSSRGLLFAAGAVAAGALLGVVLVNNKPSPRIDYPKASVQMPAQPVPKTTYIQPELNLQNAKISTDPEFVQKYLDKILRSGKVTFKQTEVVYDPEFKKYEEFWRQQLEKYPNKAGIIDRFIEEMRTDRKELEIYKAEYAKGEVILRTIRPVGTAKGFDQTTRIFVFYIPPFFWTDDDILWGLEHERCHAETPYSMNVGNYDGYSNEQMMEIDGFLTSKEVEEALCYSHQFWAADRFDISPESYSGTVKGYRQFHNHIKEIGKGSNAKSELARQMVDRLFVDPEILQYRK